MTNTQVTESATIEVAPDDVSEDFERAFKFFRPQAEAIEEHLVCTFRGSLPLALHNAQMAISWVDDHEEQIAKLPGMSPVLLRELVPVIGATMVANKLIDRTASGELQERMHEGRKLRSSLLAIAGGLAAVGIVPEKEVARIRKGRGAIDAASDCVELAMLFRKYPESIAKSPVTEEEIDRCAELGTELLQSLKPGSGRDATDQAVRDAIDLRDRFWALALSRYDSVWRCGAFLFGAEGVEEVVPSLRSHRSRRSTADDDLEVTEVDTAAI